MKCSAPSRAPSQYLTVTGLLRATERLLASGAGRAAGQSKGMWLQNARWQIVNVFGGSQESNFNELVRRYAVTRPQDLHGGDSLFGVALPKRRYTIGDNVPGVGEIRDIVDTAYGRQFEICGSWYAERCFDN